jgi:hypothetical protein
MAGRVKPTVFPTSLKTKSTISFYDIRYYAPPITAIYKAALPVDTAPFKVFDVTGGEPSVILTDAGKVGVGVISSIGIFSICLLIFLLIRRRRTPKASHLKGTYTLPLEPTPNIWKKHELPDEPVHKYKYAKELASSAIHEMEAESVPVEVDADGPVEVGAERPPAEIDADRPPIEVKG